MYSKKAKDFNENLLNQFYNDLFEMHKKNVKSLGWTDEESQKLNFQIITSEIEEGQSVLDVGCGFGDLAIYMDEFFHDFDYAGIELNSNFAKIAKERLELDSNCRILDKELKDISEKFDWVVGVGLCPMVMPYVSTYTYVMIEKMFELCNIGIALNFLSPTIKEEDRPGTTYHPKFSDVIEKYILPISKRFKIDHSYKDGKDFTIFVYKDEDKSS